MLKSRSKADRSSNPIVTGPRTLCTALLIGFLDPAVKTQAAAARPAGRQTDHASVRIFTRMPHTRNPSGNLRLSTEDSADVIRVEVCALHPLHPSWLGTS